MKFGYTIIYVPDVAASLSFFEIALGLSRQLLHESGTTARLNQAKPRWFSQHANLEA